MAFRHVVVAVALMFFVSSAVIGGLAGSLTTSSDPGATITVPGTQSIPEQNVSIENEDFVVNRVKISDPGDSIEVEVTVEVNETYRVYIYNTEEQIVDDRRGEDDATFTFDLTNYPAGTYLVAVQQDGDYKAIHPLLIRGYAVDVSAPEEAREDTTIDVTTDPTYLRGNHSEYVEVVVSNGDGQIRVNATRQSDGTYATSVSLDPLPPGEYLVVANVRGKTNAYGEKEFIGISEARSLTITRPTPTPTESTGGGDTDGGGGSDGGETGTVSPTTTQPVRTRTPGTTATPPLTTPTTSPASATDATPSPSGVNTPTTHESLLTPSSPTTTLSTPTNESTPGFGIGVAVLAIVAMLALAVRAETRR